MRDPLCAEPAIATCRGNTMVEAAVSADEFRCCVEQFPLFRTKNSNVIPLFRRQRFDPRRIEIAKETSRLAGSDFAKFAVNSVVS
jgi:hypothetical protein